MRDAQYFKDHITALEEDIRMFGAAGDDTARLLEYKSELAAIEKCTTESNVDQPGDGK